MFGLRQAPWDRTPTSETDFLLVFEVLEKVLRNKNYLLILQCSQEQRVVIANLLKAMQGSEAWPFAEMKNFYYCKENSHDEGGSKFCSSVEEVLFLYSVGEQSKFSIFCSLIVL